MTSRPNHRSRGSALLEFTLVGIPLVFVLISTVQLAFGMWLYHTLAYAARQGTRYAIVHGTNCSQNGNTYCVTISNIASQINKSAVGLDPNQMSVTLTPSHGTAITDTLANLINNGTYASTTWPPTSPAGANAVGQPVTISVLYPFNSGISMFWPGTRPMNSQGLIGLPASSTDLIQF